VRSLRGRSEAQQVSLILDSSAVGAGNTRFENEGPDIGFCFGSIMTQNKQKRGLATYEPDALGKRRSLKETSALGPFLLLAIPYIVRKLLKAYPCRAGRAEFSFFFWGGKEKRSGSVCDLLKNRLNTRTKQKRKSVFIRLIGRIHHDR